MPSAYSDDFHAGWQAARSWAQHRGSVPPHPPEPQQSEPEPAPSPVIGEEENDGGDD